MPELLTLEEYLKRKRQRSQKPSLTSKEYLQKSGKDILDERLTEKEYLSKKQVKKKPERKPRELIWRPFAEKLKPLVEKIRKGITKQKPFNRGEFKSTWGFEPVQDIKPLRREPLPAMRMETLRLGPPTVETAIRPAPPKTFVDRIKDIISKPFIRTPEQEIARSQNIYAISKELDLPLATVRKNYNQLTKEMRDYPTSPELLGGMLILPITAGLMTHPVTTIIGIGGFMGLSEIESAVISKIKGEPYKLLQQKGLKDLLPEEVNQYTRDTVEILDFIGKGLILGGIYKKAPHLAEKFTKNIITEYKMPKKVYISAEKVRSIFKTGKEISPQELEFIKDLGLSGKQYRVATMKGIAIEVPAEKIVTITDKPYFSKIKHLFRLKAYKEVRTFRVGKPIEIIPEERLLPAPTREIVPPTPEIKPTIILKELQYRGKKAPALIQKIIRQVADPNIRYMGIQRFTKGKGEDLVLLYDKLVGDEIAMPKSKFTVENIQQKLIRKRERLITPKPEEFVEKPTEVYTSPEIPRPTPEITPTEKIDKVKRSEIVKYISEKLGVPIRIGRFREQAWGIYKRKEKIARIKAPTDVATAAHEIGHYLYEELKPLAKTKIDPSLIPKYAEELAPFLIDFPKGKRTPREGFSEFVNAYITDPIRAKRVAPTLYIYFENFISNYPEIQRVLKTAQQDYQRWLRLPATAKILSHISPTPEKASITTLGRLYALSIDELYPLKKYVDIIKKKGIKVFEQDDPFILATAHRGWHGKADAFLRYKTFDINYNWKGKSLQDIYRPIGEARALDDFDAFLVAKRSLELIKRGIKTGIEPQDARKAISELVKKYQFFEEKAEELYQYQTDLLEYAKDSELITPEGFSKMTTLNKYYVPFHRVMELAGSKGLLGRGVVNLKEIFKQIRGSQREIIRPSESIVKNTYTILDACERNQIATALVKLAEMHPEDLGKFVEKIPPVMVKLTGVSLKDLGIMTDEPGGVERVIDIFRPSILNPSENIIRVMRKGKKSYYQVDPDLYKSLAATDRESTNMLIKILSYPARWLRLGAVALSPEFVVRNPVRDAFTAMVYSKGGFIPGLDTLRGVMSILGQDELYWKWKISEAEHSALVSLDREYLQKNIRDLIATYSKKLTNVIRHPLEHARILAEIGEEATRIGEYRLVLGGGRRWFLAAEKLGDMPLKSRMLRAGVAARQVTLDFSRLGAKTKAVNSIIAFWNANVQDLDKIARSFKDHPFRILYKVIAGITIPSILLYLANKDDARVNEVSQWQKDIFWIVTTKHITKERWDKMETKERSAFAKRYPIFRIPKPFTLGILFGTVPERMLDYAYKEDPEAFKGLFKTVSKAVNPGFIPTAFLAPMEAITNYSLFLDRPIEPMGIKRLLPEQRYTQYTTETSKLIGKALGISPTKIEYFLRGYWGSLGRVGMETLDLMLRTVKLVPKPKGPTPTLADIPMVRGFVVREPAGSASEALNEFYELYEKSQMAEATIKDLIKKRDKELVNKYKTQYPEYRAARDFRAVAKRLSDLRKRRIEVWESDKLTREKKRDKILEIEREMTKIARRLLNRYRELIKKERKQGR